MPLQAYAALVGSPIVLNGADFQTLEHAKDIMCSRCLFWLSVNMQFLTLLCETADSQKTTQ